jgi:hypothetical protein
MKKIDKFTEIFHDKLKEAPTNKDAFDKAKVEFQDQTGLEAYSSYRSFLVVLGRSKK